MRKIPAAFTVLAATGAAALLSSTAASADTIDADVQVGGEGIASVETVADLAQNIANHNLNENAIANGWNVEVLNNSPIATDVTLGTGTLTNATDSINETANQLLSLGK